MASLEELPGSEASFEAHPDVIPHAREHLAQHQTIIARTLHVLQPLVVEFNHPSPEFVVEE